MEANEKSRFYDCPHCGAGGVIPDENGRCTNCKGILVGAKNASNKECKTKDDNNKEIQPIQTLGKNIPEEKTNMICRICQHKIADDDVNSVDGWLYCSSCLKEKKDSTEVDNPSKIKLSSETGWTIGEMKIRRAIYLIVFLLLFASNFACFLFGTMGIYVIHIIIIIVFLAIFINVARLVLGYSWGNLAGIALIMFIPFVSLLTVMYVDRRIYAVVKGVQEPPSQINQQSGQIIRQLSSLAVFSLVLCPIPFIGLPMAIVAVRKISRSNECLYGKTLARISVVVNGLLLGMMILGITIGILTSK